MTIKNVVRTNNAVLSVAGGSVSALASSPGDSAALCVYHNACKRTTAWFEGRLWTFRLTSYPTGSGVGFRRWDNVPTPDTWADQPDFSGVWSPGSNYLGYFNAGSGSHYGMPGLISFKDNVYLFWDRTANWAGSGASATHSWAYMRWNPNPGPNGATTVEAYYNTNPGYYHQTYTRSISTVDNGHILDIAEYNGNFYIATPVNLLSITPPNGDLTVLDEPSTNWDNMVARSLGLFKAGSGSTMLLMLDANGLVKQITGAVSQIANLKLINANITNGNTASLGYGTAIVQIGTYAYAFLNDTTGTVLFRSSDGTNWSEISANLPTAWRNTHSHVKYAIDPSVPEVRIMFINASSGTFDIYSYDGTTFTFLGSGSSSTNLGYTYFDLDAADAELEGTVSVNISGGTASIPFQLFKEVSATGIISVAAEYSIDGGTTWNTATGTPKVSLDASDSRPAGTGASYTFTWNWQTDLGVGLYPNVRFRIRSI